MLAITQAIASHALTGDQALAVLVGMLGSGHDRIEGAARAEIHLLVNQHAVTPDHALQVLAGLPASGSPELQHVIGSAMAAAMIDERGRLLVSVDHAIGVLAGIAARGDANLQVALGGEIAGLRGGLHVDVDHGDPVTAAISHAVASNSLKVDAALAVLAGMLVGNENNRIETAARAEISALVGGEHAVTPDHALEVLARLPAGGSPDLQHAIGVAMYAATMDEHGRALVTVDHAIDVLARVATHGDASLQLALGGELLALRSALHVSSEGIDPVMRGITHAVGSNTLTGDAALAILTGMLVGNTNNKIEAAARSEISVLIGQHAVTPDHALEVLAGLPASGSPALEQAIGSAMYAAMTDERGRLVVSVDRAIGVLAGIAAHGDTGVQTALGGEIAALRAALHLSGEGTDPMMRAITNAVTSHTLTADQAITLLASIAAHENDLGAATRHSFERDVAQEISSLIHSGAVTAAQAQADITPSQAKS
jgi:hypothetical protein